MWPEFCRITEDKNIPVLMPGHQLGNLEWSKITGKKMLKHLGIPTAPYVEMTKGELFKNYFNIPRPFVIKYEKDWRVGLQTIVVTEDNYQQEFETLVNAPAPSFPGAIKDSVFLVESFVNGTCEYSWHAICNTTGWQYLGSARDYKKRHEGDQGHNTASMGSYAPAPSVDPRVHDYADKIIKFLAKRRTPYLGILYLGIMHDQDGTPIVLEINTRPGCPEIESIIPTLDVNLLDLFYATALDQPLPEIKFNDCCAVSLRVVNKVYNESIDSTDDHVEMPKLWPMIGGIQQYLNNNPRLLYSTLTATDSTVDGAADQIYKFLKNKFMGDFTYRTDIGYFK
jgi:phosphoribosylamine-glycine ligase